MSTESSDVYAVIRSGGKQYRVSPGQRVKLERLEGGAGDRVAFDEVLMVKGGGEVAVGAPTLEGASVAGEIVEQGRGRKIRVFKYKNKTRYRRLRGHRQLHTSVLVQEVSHGGQTWAVEADEAAPAEADEPTEAVAEEEAEAAVPDSADADGAETADGGDASDDSSEE